MTLPDEVKASLRCRACEKILHPPIRMCGNGHNVCSMCKKGDDFKCPACKDSVGDNSNVSLEALIKHLQVWLPDGYSQIFRSYVFGPSGSWTMAPLCYAAKFDPFLSLDCAPTPSTLAQSKERTGYNFAIWQPCSGYITSIKNISTFRVKPDRSLGRLLFLRENQFQESDPPCSHSLSASSHHHLCLSA